MISVVIASYNGEKYIVEQIESVLSELGSNDEVVVVDDCSTDHTVARVRGIGDVRIVVYELAVNVGHVRAFEFGLQLVSGDFIMLCDQDDVWPTGRVDMMRKAIGNDAGLCVGSLHCFGEGFVEPRDICLPDREIVSPIGHVMWLMEMLRGSAPYFGSAMLLRRSILNVVLPFPHYVTAHDHWIPMVAHACGRVAETSAFVVDRRLHGGNQSNSQRPLMVKLRYRVTLARMAGAAHRLYLRRGQGLWTG